MPGGTPKTGRPSPARAVSRLGVIGLCLLAAGCAAPVDARPRGPLAAEPPAWESVFLAPSAMARLDGTEPATLPEYARRDQALALRVAEPLLAGDQWPAEPRPSLLAQRRILIADTERTAVFYFAPDRAHRRHQHAHPAPPPTWYWYPR